MSILFDKIINIINNEFEKLLEDLSNSGYPFDDEGYKMIIDTMENFENYRYELETILKKELDVYLEKMAKYLAENKDILFDKEGNFENIDNFDIKNKIIDITKSMIGKIIVPLNYPKVQEKFLETIEDTLNNNQLLTKCINLYNINFNEDISSIIEDYFIFREDDEDDSNQPDNNQLGFEISFNSDGNLEYLKLGEITLNKDNWENRIELVFK
jgi:hypothetical protein